MGFLAGTWGLIFVIKNFHTLNGSALLKEVDKKISVEPEHKEEVSDLADWAEALQESHDGLKVLNELDVLTDRSKRMSNMIRIIDDISFQTNLLALNAAVNAASVGEQPRSFPENAVVLARQAAKVSAELGALLRDVREGAGASGLNTPRVSATSSTMEETTRRIAEIVASIQAATESTPEGITQMNIVAARLIAISAMFNTLEHDAKAIEQAMQGDIDAIAKTGVISSST